MLNRKLIVCVGVLTLIVLSNTAVAQGDFYVLGSLGNTDIDVSFKAEYQIAGGRGSYKLGAGYAFNRYLSLEAAYSDFGNEHARTDCPPGLVCAEMLFPIRTTADSKAYSFSAIGGIPLTDRFDVYGKIGVASWDIDFAGSSSVFDASGEDLFYGAGVRWSLDRQWRIFAEFNKVEIGLDTAGIGVNYHF